MLAMKPRFALNLTNDDATLLERSAEGWVPLGRAPFDAPDLKAQLDRLRAMHADAVIFTGG